MTLDAMKMTDQTRKAEHFRALHIPGNPPLLFNIWDAGSAKAVAAAGAKAIATSSWSVANANGFSDGEQIPLALAIENLRRIVGATYLPVTIDLESGYGDTPELIAETIGLAIEAGGVGCASKMISGERKTPERSTSVSVFELGGRRINRCPFLHQRPYRRVLPATTRRLVRLYRGRHQRTRVRGSADGIFVPGLVDGKLIALRAIVSAPCPTSWSETALRRCRC
jgi:hypothetical protein